jgi:hypothetical protein
MGINQNLGGAPNVDFADQMRCYSDAGRSWAAYRSAEIYIVTRHLQPRQ